VAYLFADDTKIFRIINNFPETLQDDLKQLETSENWLLKFNPEKCKHIHMQRKKEPNAQKYKLLGNEIERVSEEKDIGVTIDEELTFEKHLLV
jgi:hypothetical protein